MPIKKYITSKEVVTCHLTDQLERRERLWVQEYSSLYILYMQASNLNACTQYLT